MLQWAAAGFNCNGPANDRTRTALPVVEQAVAYMSDPDLPKTFNVGGWAEALWHATESGELTTTEAQSMLADYWAPSLDTTIFGTTNAIWLFGRHPEQWQALRSAPNLLPHAVNEVLRLESPLPYFSRVTTKVHRFGQSTIPEGARVLLMYGSANRDERKWIDPERFDVRRKPSDHLAFGHGEHACVGQGLARMEITALLQAMLERVHSFELGEHERAINNWARGMARLEVKVRPL